MGAKVIKRAKKKNSKRKVDLRNLDINTIWKYYHDGRRNSDGDLFRNELMEQYRHLVRYAAERLYSKLSGNVELDDLISAGTFGLMDAIDAYDPDRGVKFETYCLPRIKGSILDELRAMDWVPRLVRTRQYQVKRAKAILETRLGRLPDDIELAEELGLDKYKAQQDKKSKIKNREKARRILRDSHAPRILSLESTGDETSNDGDKEPYLSNLIKDTKNLSDPEKMMKQNLKQILLTGLTRAEKLIVMLYYYEEMTMKEVGAVLDLSESRVSQMHSSVVLRLKSQLTAKGYTPTNYESILPDSKVDKN